MGTDKVWPQSTTGEVMMTEASREQSSATASTMPTLAQEAAAEHKGSFTGEALRQSQERHEAFDKVNREWLKKCLTFEQMLKDARDFQARCQDIDGVSFRSLLYRNGAVSAAGRVMELSEQAVEQLGYLTGIPSRYLFELMNGEERDGEQTKAPDLELLDLNLTRRAALRADRECFLRTKQEADGSIVLRAILSDRYAVINNLPVIETLADIVPGGRVSHLNYDGDTFRANILIPDTLRAESDSDYGGGISVINNETGRYPYRQRPFVFRHICWNGNVWDRKDGRELGRRHIGDIDWADFRRAIVTNLQTQIPLVQANIEKVLALKGIPVTEQDIRRAIVYIGKTYSKPRSLSEAQMRAWSEGFAAELRAARNAKEILTAFGLVQGLTRAAQGSEDMKGQELMEALSGRLIDGNFDKVLSGAVASVTEEEVESVLG